MDKKTILIGADIVPTEVNAHLFEGGDARTLLGDELLEIFKSADFRIFNLEVPLSDIREPILKSGPNLAASEKCINGYKALLVNLLAVANNHTLDQGKRAFADTLRVLRENGIPYVGGGECEEEVKRPFVFELSGMKFGVINFCEHEFSWFSDYGIGSNGFDPLYSLDEVAALKESCDYVIALYHGGREHYRYPSPELQRICRRIAEKGADLVICQHTHCVGARENWDDCEIVYGQGNAIFTKENVGDDCWNTGMLIRLTVSSTGVSVDYIPTERTALGAKLSHDPSILGGFEERSAEISTPGFVKERYLKLVLENEEGVRMHFSYFGECLGESTKRAAAARNIINCAPHREMLVTYLTELHGLK